MIDFIFNCVVDGILYVTKALFLGCVKLFKYLFRKPKTGDNH